MVEISESFKEKVNKISVVIYNIVRKLTNYATVSYLIMGKVKINVKRSKSLFSYQIMSFSRQVFPHFSKPN